MLWGLIDWWTDYLSIITYLFLTNVVHMIQLSPKILQQCLLVLPTVGGTVKLGSSWLSPKRRLTAAIQDQSTHPQFTPDEMTSRRFFSDPHHQMVIIWLITFFIYLREGEDKKTTPNSTSAFAPPNPKSSDHIRLWTLLHFKMMFGLSDPWFAQMSNHNKPHSSSEL